MRCKNLWAALKTGAISVLMRSSQKRILAKIARHGQKILRPETFSDREGAVNGLQAENSGAATRIAAAVDPSPATIKLAIAAGEELGLNALYGGHYATETFWCQSLVRRTVLDNGIHLIID
jgi:putative NIF3 family GTP cyclohydrolase 1 type 2